MMTWKIVAFSRLVSRRLLLCARLDVCKLQKQQLLFKPAQASSQKLSNSGLKQKFPLTRVVQALVAKQIFATSLFFLFSLHLNLLARVITFT
jgi:hypothetical protein